MAVVPMATASAPSAKRLRQITTVSHRTGVDERDVATLAKVIDRPPGLAYGGDTRDAGFLRGKVRARSGRTFHAVDVYGVGIALHGHAHVVVDTRRTQLELDRDLPIGRLTDFVDLERQVIRAQPVRVARRRALVDSRWQRTHLGDLIGHLLAHEVAAETDLAALADEELAPRRPGAGDAD